MNKKKTTKKKTGKGGRPSAYQPSYARIAKFMCERGADDKEVAACLGVDERTVNRWKHDHDEFCQSLKKGKERHDHEIVRALAERAKGYSHKETKVFCNSGEIVTHEVDKHYPPDVTACIYWLNNRKPKEWASRKAVETTITSESTPPVIMVPGIMSVDDWEKAGKENQERINKAHEQLEASR